jgi:aerobic-type carbon monoxide dehydrogenase small subunit (CoxS/CutS family)
VEAQAFQCSFCTPGFLMSAQALLDSTEGPIDIESMIRGLDGHLCRCGCYETIKEAIIACASSKSQENQGQDTVI